MKSQIVLDSLHSTTGLKMLMPPMRADRPRSSRSRSLKQRPHEFASDDICDWLKMFCPVRLCAREEGPLALLAERETSNGGEQFGDCHFGETVHFLLINFLLDGDVPEIRVAHCSAKVPSAFAGELHPFVFDANFPTFGMEFISPNLLKQCLGPLEQVRLDDQDALRWIEHSPTSNSSNHARTF